MSRSAGLVAMLVCLLLAAGTGSARAEVRIDRLTTAVEPASLQEVLRMPVGAWGPLGTEPVRMGPWRRVVWLRLGGLTPSHVVGPTSIVDFAELYWRDPDGRWRSAVSGDRIPYADRVVKATSIALALDGSPVGDVAYLRIEQASVLAFGIRVESQESLQDREESDRLLRLFLTGFVVAIIAYNLIVSALLRDRVFLFNALTIVSLLVVAMHLSGDDAWLLWPERPEWGDPAMNLGLACANAFGLLFVHAFLRRSGAPPARRARMLWPVPLFALAALASLAGASLPYGWIRLALLVGSVSTLLIIAAAIGRRALLGDGFATILAIPFAIGMMPGVLLTVAHRIGGAEFGLLLRNALEFSLALEAMLFSLVIAMRVRSAEQGRVHAERELRRTRDVAASRMLQVLDRERKRVAQDIHDSAGQRLLFLINTLRQRAGQPVTSADDAAEGFAEAAGQAAQVLDGLRRISRNMHPASLAHLGWVGAVKGLLTGVDTDGGPSCESRFAVDEGRLDDEQRLHLYRIVQEAISNIVRHANATRCRVSFETTAADFEMVISDDGRGFGESSVGTRSFGLGLTSIQERVRILGGRLEIGVADEGGVRMRVVVPLSRTDATRRRSLPEAPEGGANERSP